MFKKKFFNYKDIFASILGALPGYLLLNNLNIELIGTVKGDLVKKISEDNFYSVDGKYIKNLQDLNPYYDYGLWNVSLGKNKLLDANDVYFGVNLYQIANLN